MANSQVSELLQLLQEVIARDLKALSIKMDGLQRQMELSQKTTQAQLDAFRGEQVPFAAK